MKDKRRKWLEVLAVKQEKEMGQASVGGRFIPPNTWELDGMRLEDSRSSAAGYL